MSLKGKFQQFVRWLNKGRKADRVEDTFPEVPSSGTWEQNETQSKADEFNQAAPWWITVGLFTTSYLDGKLRNGSGPRPGSGPITGNNDQDALILLGCFALLIAGLVRIFKS